MPRPRNPHPKMIREKSSGQAVCWFTDPVTNRRRGVRLGPWGSAEAQERYARLLAEVRAGTVRQQAPAAGVTVAELCERFAGHALEHYGPRSSEFAHYKAVLGALADLAGEDPASAFGPAAFKRVRQAFVARGWQRQYVNDQARRVRTLFKWAVGEELVAPGVWQALAAVAGLGKGRTAAPERAKVAPAPLRDVVRVMRLVPTTVAAMCRFQWLTGCRCQDVCGLRWEDLDRTGDVWVHRPGSHKGAWRGQAREVFVGPKAQRLLVPHLAARGPVFRSRLGDRYRVGSYCRAVLRACRRAGVPEWSPGQLRHAAGTRFRALFGIEAAQVLLGHAKADVTQIYAEKPKKLAMDWMRRAG